MLGRQESQLAQVGVGVRWGLAGLEFEGKAPTQVVCTWCAAKPNFAELHAHTALLSNVGQRFLNLYIAAAEH